MGSRIEINDTLQITAEQGFPVQVLDLERQQAGAISFDSLENTVFEFRKPEIRLYHPAPTRVFLVQNINGKWLYWGKALVLEQTIHALEQSTSGRFQIIRLYDPEYQRLITINESPEGKSYF